MILSDEILASIDKSVLRWLATSADGLPNVSPKEIFCHHQDYVLVANIASPRTVKNIRTNPRVCISFVDVLVQKGFQLKGKAEIVEAADPNFDHLLRPLEEMINGRFPVYSITRIVVEEAKPILAPSYLFYPETEEADMVESAKTAYGLG